ncbi:MAG TPA: high-affinity nickel-transport family protein [Terriglobales bacterium]|nr:high-affinity nickel-transport family protein [Terriglobales bacterium]
MISLLSILALGFFLGMRHATDPDHVIAITTIITRQRRISRAALTGIVWGLGHTITIFVVGAAIIVFGLVIPARIGLSMELSVGVMLIVLGGMNVSSFFRAVPAELRQCGGESEIVHSHAHSHGEYVHSHPHGHEPDVHPHSPDQTPLARLDRRLGMLSLYQQARPLIVGVVHGLAGSAAVALLVLTTIRDSRWAIAYLLVFGVGTIAGMMLITMSLASAFRFLGSGREGFSRWLGVASGLISLAFGLVLAYQICFVNGLLSGHPQWTPR